MAINICNNLKTFYLHTKNSTYAFFAHKSGALIHLYYGARTSGNLNGLYYEEFFSFAPYEKEGDTFSLATASLEISGFGVGDFRVPSLILKGERSAFAVKPIFKGYEIIDGDCLKDHRLPCTRKDGVQTLIITCMDESLNAEIKLYYTVYEEEDTIVRSVSVENLAKAPLIVDGIASLSLDFYGEDLNALYLGGGYYYENQARKTEIPIGITEFSSTTGSTGHGQNPAVMLYEKSANEESGNVYSFNLLYSGNFSSKIQKNGMEQIRFTIGINPTGFSWKLDDGEILYSPEAVLSYANGFAKASLNNHRFVRRYLSPQRKELPPVLFNTWEAKYFDVDQKVLEEATDLSLELGLNLVVLDDGWFSTRKNDYSGLGDWVVNEEKFPEGLEELSRKINEKGLAFGLWIEPEMVNPQSKLYQSHPEWVIHIAGRKSSLSRHQYVLDFSNPQVVDYIYNSFEKLFKKLNIVYIKWDMNRYLTEVGSSYLDEDRQGEVAHRFTLGFYTLQKKLQELLPDVYFEGCSGGGGRFDLGVLNRSNAVWVSDNTDAYERIKTQFGNGFFYPASTLAVHIGRSPQGFTARYASIKFRYAVALMGVLGVELDPKTLSKDEFDDLKRYIAQYKEYEKLIVKGDYYRLSKLEDLHRKCAFSYVSEDKSAALAVYLQILGETNKNRLLLKLKGLEENALYKLSGDLNGEYYGMDLMNAGVVLPHILGDGQAVIVKLDKIKE